MLLLDYGNSGDSLLISDNRVKSLKSISKIAGTRDGKDPKTGGAEFSTSCDTA